MLSRGDRYSTATIVSLSGDCPHDRFSIEIPCKSPRPAWPIAMAVGAVVWLFCSLAVAYALTHRRGARSDEPVPSIADMKIETHRLKTRDGEELARGLLRGGQTGPAC